MSGENLSIWARFCTFWPCSLGQISVGCCFSSALGSGAAWGMTQNRRHSRATDQYSMFALNMRNSGWNDALSAAF